MKKNLFVSFASLMLVVFTFFACIKEVTKKDDGNLSKDIQNIVPDTTLQKIINLGMVVNKGTTPTNLVNIYKVSPYILKSSNISSDYAGKTFSDYKFKLYDQDNAKLTIKLDYVNGPETGTGLGGFIAGSGNDFSVFVKVHTLVSNSPADILFVLSGTITSGGINNFIMSNYMLDNYGNTSGYYINNGQGRVIYDSDKFSPIVTSLQAITNNDNLNIMGMSGAFEVIK